MVFKVIHSFEKNAVRLIYLTLLSGIIAVDRLVPRKMGPTLGSRPDSGNSPARSDLNLTVAFARSASQRYTRLNIFPCY